MKTEFRDKDGALLALHVTSADAHDVEFYTDPQESLQLATFKRPLGYRVEAHRHKPEARPVYFTHEVLVVVSGKLFVQVFSTNERGPNVVGETFVYPTEAIMFLGGAHSVIVHEEAIFYEIKQGPYMGKDEKVFLWEGGPQV